MLWINNERQLYDMKIKAFSDFYEKKLTDKQFMQKMNQLGAYAHRRYSDIKREKLTKKEIIELRKNLKSEYKEYKDYRSKNGSY